jgi:DNA-binding transcriptional MerR regulator
MPDPAALFWTYREAAQLARATPRTVAAWVQKGLFPQPVRIGGKILFAAADVRKALKLA